MAFSVRKYLPGRRFLVFTSIATLLWLTCAAFYAVLPSKAPSDAIVAAKLAAGKPILRIFDIHSLYGGSVPGRHQTPPAVRRLLSGWGKTVILEFDIQSTADGGDYISIGGGFDPLAQLPFDVGRGERLNSSRILLTQASRPFDNETSVSEPFSVNVGQAGGYRTDFAFPWFSDADAALISWWTASHQPTLIPLRVRRLPDQNLVEIWPESWYWYDNSYPDPPSDLNPLLTIQVNSGDDNDGKTQYQFHSRSSSTTPIFYSIRVGLMCYLLPLGFVVVACFHFTLAIISTAVRIVIFILSILMSVASFLLVIIFLYVAGWWLWNGRPSYSETKEAFRRKLSTQGSFSWSVSWNAGDRVPGVRLAGPERDLEAGGQSASTGTVPLTNVTNTDPTPAGSDSTSPGPA